MPGVDAVSPQPLVIPSDGRNDQESGLKDGGVAGRCRGAGAEVGVEGSPPRRSAVLSAVPSSQGSGLMTPHACTSGTARPMIRSRLKAKCKEVR